MKKSIKYILLDVITWIGVILAIIGIMLILTKWIGLR